ncbi:hypothetical protein [Marinobacter nauticus]|uniref:Helicase/UvrB N-terminal domain-containing protein n=1 Tax=Marinobacter nauticus TaxID=2743 RepID=A0A1M2UXI8_MARNT|nr:hypothetical protein [Marinobacter nauticus]OJS99990.1 hypothetical protein BEE62_07710 [Marinobacter nauticus]
MKMLPADSSARTPLDRLLQEDLAPQIGPDAESGCLALIPAQTGIGKTHTIKQLIIEELVASVTEERSAQTIYYITNSVDNVRQTYEEVLELIDEQQVGGNPRFSDSEKTVLKRKLVYLPNQGSQLLDVAPACVEQIIQLFGLQSDKRLQKNWQHIRKLQRLTNESLNSKLALQDTLNQHATETYRLLISLIQTRQRSENPVQLSPSDLELIDELIPGDRLYRQDARICFMTTRKFLAGYQTLKARIHPIRELGNALLLIDEFDRQNEIILQFMADQKSLDLIELTRTLYANLQQHQLERSCRYEGIEEKFDTLRPALAEFAERWNLQFAFNTDGASLENEKVRLFSDRTVTHAHSSSHRFSLVTNDDLRKNIIKTQARAIADDHKSDPRLSRFINEADWLFRRFIWVMRSSVWLYLSNHAKSERDNEALRAATVRDAVHSILRHFNLHDLSSAVFAAFDAQASFTGRRPRNDSSDNRSASRTYHDNGLKLTDVRRNDGTIDTVSCYYSGFTVTPSGLIARLVESGVKIVGISATATSRTVIKNFDLDYLKTRLGNQFIELTDTQKAEIGNWYRTRRQYNETGVRIETEFMTPESRLLPSALEAYINAPVRTPGLAISHLLDLEDSDTFALNWVGKLFNALDRFMDAENNRYMLALLNRTVSPSKYPKFIDFLEDYLNRKSAGSGKGYKLFCGINAQAMSHGGFDSILNHLSSSKDKVIVLSAYASMGEGKNPDYAVNNQQDREQLVWVGDGHPPEKVRTDIDTLYLEKPTHQLLSDPDNYQVNQLLLFHQIMALQEAGWISLSEARSWVKQTLQGMHHNQHLKRYYETADYEWLIRKVIEQAVGRTARTAFKRLVIRLFADGDLRPILASDHRQEATLSHEYIALRKAASESREPANDNRELLRLHNKAALATADTLSLIRELMSGFRGAAPESAIKSWESLRNQLLTEPTQPSPSSDYPRLYLQSPRADGYRFSGSLEVDDQLQSDKDLRFFEQAIGSRWINESGSGLPELMKNTVVRSHFQRKGFATHWQAQPYHMNPAAFFNLYKGALGEEGIAAILEYVGLAVDPLSADVYELCDFVVRPSASHLPIAVDAKHWRSDGHVDNHKLKAEKLRESLGVNQFAYINLFGGHDQSCRHLSQDLTPCNLRHSPVIEVPGLLNPQTGDLLQDNLTTLLEWMGEHQ